MTARRTKTEYKANNGRKPGHVLWRNPDDPPGVFQYDVSHVEPALPFPLRRNGNVLANRIELPPELERYRIYTEDELGSFPPVDWLIPRYLAAGELTVFYGKGDTYKTFAALDWGALLARGDLLVIYVAAEGASGMLARVGAWKKYRAVERLPKLRVMPSNVNLHDPEAVKHWIEAMRLQLGEETPVLVIVDTLARNFVGGDESSPRDMGMFVEGVERIRRELRTAVLVLHHSTKAGDTERGTESLRNASFAMYEFKRTGGRPGAVSVTCDRMKEAEPADRPATATNRSAARA